MLKLAIRRVRPEKEKQLRSWLAELIRECLPAEMQHTR